MGSVGVVHASGYATIDAPGNLVGCFAGQAWSAARIQNDDAHDCSPRERRDHRISREQGHLQDRSARQKAQPWRRGNGHQRSCLPGLLDWSSFDFAWGSFRSGGRPSRLSFGKCIMKDTTPNFKGKVLSVALCAQGWSRAIQDPHFEMQCGRLFLVGVSPKDASTKDWVAGLPYAIAWDSVADYAVFDSVDQYLERLNRYYGKKQMKRGSRTIGSR